MMSLFTARSRNSHEMCDNCKNQFHKTCEKGEAVDPKWFCSSCFLRQQYGFSINSLPLEVLRSIFVELCFEKETMHITLSLVCRKWNSIVNNEGFQTSVNHTYLNRCYNVQTWSREKRKRFYTGISISTCMGCLEKYKQRIGYYRDPITRCEGYYPPDDETERGQCRLCAPIYCWPENLGDDDY